jgi:hypothetical protein
MTIKRRLRYFLQVAMDYLIRLDIANAMPIFRDYLIVMNELVEHPDQVKLPTNLFFA